MSINVVEEKKKFLIDFFSVFWIFFIFCSLDWEIGNVPYVYKNNMKHGVHDGRLSNTTVDVVARIQIYFSLRAMEFFRSLKKMLLLPRFCSL